MTVKGTGNFLSWEFVIWSLSYYFLLRHRKNKMLKCNLFCIISLTDVIMCPVPITLSGRGSLVTPQVFGGAGGGAGNKQCCLKTLGQGQCGKWSTLCYAFSQ